MKILPELIEILTEAAKSPKVSRQMAGRVYRRDYLKTKDRPYRKYNKRHVRGEQ